MELISHADYLEHLYTTASTGVAFAKIISLNLSNYQCLMEPEVFDIMCSGLV